jgi:predicted HD superfamily hydrolase involved in NAD metabolism
MNQALITQYTSFLEETLSPGRFKHSLGVMQVMGELAEVYALDPEKAAVAGLLHDAAKELPPVQQEQLLCESGIRIENPVEQDFVLYLHGPVGAYLVSKELNVTDPQILDGIYRHTFSGVEGPLSAFVWCLRFADILEPYRNWQDVRWFRDGGPRLRDAVYSRRLAEGAFLQSGWVMQMYQERGYAIHPNIRRVFEELSGQLGLDERDLEV